MLVPRFLLRRTCNYIHFDSTLLHQHSFLTSGLIRDCDLWLLTNIDRCYGTQIVVYSVPKKLYVKSAKSRVPFLSCFISCRRRLTPLHLYANLFSSNFIEATLQLQRNENNIKGSRSFCSHHCSRISLF